MHPTIEYEITKARIADRQRQAEQVAIAQAARRACRALTPQCPYLAIGLARRVLTLLAVRGRPASAWSRPLAARRRPAPCNTCVTCV
jgi:hypothetical protein